MKPKPSERLLNPYVLLCLGILHLRDYCGYFSSFVFCHIVCTLKLKKKKKSQVSRAQFSRTENVLRICYRFLESCSKYKACQCFICLYEKEFIVFLFPASSLEDWTHIVAPSPDDQVVISLKALIDECVHGRNYCKQVLCLYELSKVCV